MPGKATQLSLGSIGQVAINVHDLARAVRFYRDTLGMRLLFEVPGMAFFDCDGVRLMLGLPSAPEFDHPASIIYYRVRDIHVTRDALVARGVRFASEPHRAARLPDHDLWLGFFPDSEGNMLAVMSEVRGDTRP
jgi:catechol 2,3-dioxygenase-like lactoylglutathione lyase family enzyme